MSVKISELTAAGALDGTEEIPVVQGGATKKVTINDLLPVQLQTDRTVDLNGNDFDLVNGATSLGLHIKIGDGAVAINNPNGNKLIEVSDDADRAIIEYNTSTNIILGVGGNKIAYTADTHTFNGNVGLANLGGNGSGFAAVDNNGVLTWTAGDPANTIYDADGSISNNRTVDLNTHELQIVDSSDRIFGYWSEEDKISYLQADDGTAKTFFAAYANSVGVDIHFEISSTGGGNNIGITGNSTSGALAYTGLLHSFTGRVSALNGLTLTISEFADNAAALAGGLSSGGIYYTTVDGEQILKRAND